MEIFTRKRALMLALCCAVAALLAHMRVSALEPLMVGADQEYKTLSAAIANASDGQTIHIVGSVTEKAPANPIVISKRLTIQGGGGLSSFTISAWAQETAPFQIEASGVVIDGVNLTVNGGETTCSPIDISGADFRLTNLTLSLTGGSKTAFQPISVNADGLSMHNVTIAAAPRAAIVMDLAGHRAEFVNVTLTAGANSTVLYSSVAPQELILNGCTLGVTAATSKCVSIPSPEGLTLNRCTFLLTGSGSGTGLVLTQPSDRVAAKTLTARDCVFNINTLGTGIDLNGYNGAFISCEFNYSRAGIGILSQSASNAGLRFVGCDFYMAKSSGDKSGAAKGLVLKNSEHGTLLIDNCNLIASGAPTAEVPTTAVSSQIISSTDGMLSALTIQNSTITLNAGANTSVGVTAAARNVTITDCTLSSGATSSKCIAVSGADSGGVSNCTADISASGSSGIVFSGSDEVTVRDCTFNTAARSGVLLGFTDSTNISVTECNFNSTAELGGTGLLSFIGSANTRVYKCAFNVDTAAGLGLGISAGTGGSVNHTIENNIFNIRGSLSKGILVGAQPYNNNVTIRNNDMHIDLSFYAISIAYGRSYAVYNNKITSSGSDYAIVSDGVDEIAPFSFETDDDIYVDGSIIDEYRNQIHNNILIGRFERGIYSTNNGEVIRDNDFTSAVFDENDRSTQLLVAYSKDVIITGNKFAKPTAPHKQVIRINNAVISHVTGNKTRLADGATQVLFVEGTTQLLPDNTKYPESITHHDVTNTVNGVTPVEIVHEWSDPDNLIYEYILALSDAEPKQHIVVTKYLDSEGNEIIGENVSPVADGDAFVATAPAIEGHVFVITTVDDTTVPDKTVAINPVVKNHEIIFRYASVKTETELFNHNWYIRGYGDNTLKPDSNLTRAEAAMIFYRLAADAGKHLLIPRDVLNDVDPDAWYAKAVTYLYDRNVINGYSDGTFRPNDFITRAELAGLSDIFAAQHNATGYISRSEAVTEINRALERNFAFSGNLGEQLHEWYDLAPGHPAYGDMMEASHSHVYKKENEYEIWQSVDGTGIAAEWNE